MMQIGWKNPFSNYFVSEKRDFLQIEYLVAALIVITTIAISRIRAIHANQNYNFNLEEGLNLFMTEIGCTAQDLTNRDTAANTIIYIYLLLDLFTDERYTKGGNIGTIMGEIGENILKVDKINKKIYLVSEVDSRDSLDTMFDFAGISPAFSDGTVMTKKSLFKIKELFETKCPQILKENQNTITQKLELFWRAELKSRKPPIHYKRA